MKIAEALVLRAEAKKKFESLRIRIGDNARVQEGDTPHEDPSELMKQALHALSAFTDLIQRINVANSVNKLPDGRTLMEAIGQLRELERRHSLICHAISAASSEPDRYSRQEIKWVSTIDVKEYQQQLEEVALQIRDLNLLIQETNWTTDLG